MNRVRVRISVVLSILLFAVGIGSTSGQTKAVDSLQVLLGKTKADSSRVDLLNQISFAYYSTDTTQAEIFRKQAETLSNTLHYSRGIAFGTYLKGLKYSYGNNYLLAINAHAEAIQMAQKIHYYSLIARAYNSIGGCNFRLQDYYNAGNAFENALAAMNLADDKSYLPAILHNLGALAIKQKKYDEGLMRFRQAVELNLTSGNTEWLAKNYLEMGQAYSELKINKKAVLNANKAFTLAREAGNARIELNSLLLLGRVYINYGRYHIAQRYLDGGFRIAVGKNLKREQLAFYKEYATLYEKQGHFQNAFGAEKKYTALYDSVYNAGQARLILEFQEKFKSQQQQAENELLKAEKLNNAEQLTQKNQLLTLLIVLLVFFVLCSLVIFWGYRRIRHSHGLLKAQKNEIQKQKDNVEHLNHIKDKLFSVISHDLRSPFASLKNMMDLYEEGHISKDDTDFFFKEIRKDIGTNSLLLDNLLVWSKSQLQGFKINPLSVSVEKVFEEVVYLNSKKISNRGLQVKLNIQSDLIVLADYEMTKSVARNLLVNAIKFSPKDSVITVSASRKAEMILVSVADTGVGISRDKKEQLFKESFVTTYGVHKEKGTGLGLQICKDFVEKHGGRIWVESTEGEGSIFYFTLPRSEETHAIPMVSSHETLEFEKRQLKESIKDNVLQQKKYDRYELLAKATNDTVYDWDIERDEIRWNESLKSNFGYNSEATDMQWWTNTIHPEDRKRVETEIIAVLDDKKANIVVEYRFLTSEGQYKQVLDRGLVLYSDTGTPIRMIGSMQTSHMRENPVSEIPREDFV